MDDAKDNTEKELQKILDADLTKEEEHEQIREVLLQPILSDIKEDKRLTDKQRDWLLAFFGQTQFGHGSIKEACRIANCSWVQCRRWRNDEGFEAFQEYYQTLEELIVIAAEEGMIRQIVNGFWPAQKFALERLSNKYKEKLDVTSDGKPITTINVFRIEKKEDDNEQNT